MMTIRYASGMIVVAIGLLTTGLQDEANAQANSLFGRSGPLSGGNSPSFGSSSMSSSSTGFSSQRMGSGSNRLGGQGSRQQNGFIGRDQSGAQSNRNSRSSARNGSNSRRGNSRNRSGNRRTSRNGGNQNFNRNGQRNGNGNGNGRGGKTRNMRPRHRINFAYSPRSDSAVVQTLRTRFATHVEHYPALAGVTFRQQEGRIRLSGRVETEEDRRLAGMLVRLEPGVRSVDNQLSVQSR